MAQAPQTTKPVGRSTSEITYRAALLTGTRIRRLVAAYRLLFGVEDVIVRIEGGGWVDAYGRPHPLPGVVRVVEIGTKWLLVRIAETSVNLRWDGPQTGNVSIAAATGADVPTTFGVRAESAVPA